MTKKYKTGNYGIVFRPGYEISQTGDVFNSKTGFKLKRTVRSDSNIRCKIQCKGIRFSVNVLKTLYELYHGKLKKNYLIKFKDNDPSNTHYSNLISVKNPGLFSHTNNPSLKLTDQDVVYIRKNKNLTQKELADIFGVTQPNIHFILKRKIHKHI